MELAEDSPFRAREFVAGKDAATLATDILALDHDAFSAAFRKSPMKRAKLAGLQRNAAVVVVVVVRNAGGADGPLSGCVPMRVSEAARGAAARRSRGSRRYGREQRQSVFGGALPHVDILPGLSVDSVQGLRGGDREGRPLRACCRSVIRATACVEKACYRRSPAIRPWCRTSSTMGFR